MALKTVCAVALLVPALLSAQVRPREKDAAATKRVASSFGGFAIWLNPAVWSVVDAGPGSQTIQDRGGGVQLSMLSDARPAATNEVLKAMLEEYRTLDPKASMTDSEVRSVGGTEVMFAEYQYTAQGRPALTYGAVFGGPSGSLRILFTTVKHIPGATRRSIDTLLSGLDFREALSAR